MESTSTPRPWKPNLDERDRERPTETIKTTVIHEAWLGKGGGKKSGSSGGGIETVKNEHISSLGFGEVTGHAHKRSFGTPLTRKHAIAEMIAPHKWKVRGQGSGRR